MVFLPNIRAKKLNNDQQQWLKRNGVIHVTKYNNALSIQKGKFITSSNWFKSYSNHFHKSTFFFENHDQDSSKLKLNVKINNESAKVVVTNLSDEQIENMRTREIDSTVIYKGNFKILTTNNLHIEKLNNTDFNSKNFWIGIKYNTELFLIAFVFLILELVLFYLHNNLSS